jgi:hypothetical protein
MVVVKIVFVVPIDGDISKREKANSCVDDG